MVGWHDLLHMMICDHSFLVVLCSYDHHADVYGLASHPRRPFVYASSSRDTSLRFWSIDELIVSTIKIQAVLDGGVIQPSNLEDVGKLDQQHLIWMHICRPYIGCALVYGMYSHGVVWDVLYDTILIYPRCISSN